VCGVLFFADEVCVVFCGLPIAGYVGGKADFLELPRRDILEGSLARFRLSGIARVRCEMMWCVVGLLSIPAVACSSRFSFSWLIGTDTGLAFPLSCRGRFLGFGQEHERGWRN